MKKVIIFDLGGVLIGWDPKEVFKQHFESNEALHFFLDKICTFDWNEKQDGGRTIAEANQILIDRFPEYTKEIKAFYGEWPKMLTGEIPENVKILEAIKSSANYRLFALTNWSAETFPIAIERYKFLNCFEGILVSGVEKIKKPDPNIYKLLLEKYQLKSSECLFIDDNKRNAEAAIKEGIDSIFLPLGEDLLKKLNAYGVLT